MESRIVYKFDIAGTKCIYSVYWNYTRKCHMVKFRYCYKPELYSGEIIVPNISDPQIEFSICKEIDRIYDSSESGTVEYKGRVYVWSYNYNSIARTYTFTILSNDLKERYKTVANMLPIEPSGRVDYDRIILEYLETNVPVQLLPPQLHSYDD
jgi:hypothetical protein